MSSVDLPEDVDCCTFLQHLFDQSKYTDVIFELQSADGVKLFAAHKIVLSIWSPCFEDILYGKAESSNIVSMIKYQDINPEAFETMLKFMYGCLPELDTVKKACELYKVATTFHVTRLSTICCKFLSEVEVKPSNVFDILCVSEFIENKSLTDKCMKIIQEETVEVMSCYKCTEISPSMIHVFLDSPKLAMESEFQLLLWIFAWAKNRIIENSEYNSTREILEEFLPKLQFLSLSNEEFALLYLHHTDFFKKDEVLSIFMNIAVRGSWTLPDWYDKEKEEFRVYIKLIEDSTKTSAKISVFEETIPKVSY